MSNPRNGTARGLTARVATLEQLLEVYEGSVIEQSDRLYAEQERMRLQKTLLESQGEASPDGILSASVDDVVLFANQRLGEMWGVPTPPAGARCYRRTLRALAERATDAHGFLARALALAAGETSREELALADGRTFDCCSAPIRGEDHTGLGRVWYFRDISAFKEIASLKDEFISVVSHELRTPLTSIRGALDLMVAGIGGALPPDADSLARVAKVNCDRLVRLIDDVLDIEKIEAGRMDFKIEALELAPLIRESIAAIRPYGDQYGIHYEADLAAPTARAAVDADRLSQVMTNLLSNATKFSPRGGIVRVGLRRRNGQLHVTVTDRGPGIAPGFRSRVFEKFAQGDAANGRKIGGTGLGLSIARAIVERLGGTIDFASRPGEGTTFYVDLPEWRRPAPARP